MLISVTSVAEVLVSTRWGKYVRLSSFVKIILYTPNINIILLYNIYTNTISLFYKFNQLTCIIFFCIITLEIVYVYSNKSGESNVRFIKLSHQKSVLHIIMDNT